MIITGTYSFYQDGRLVGQSENLVTSEGKRHIMRYLAGQVNAIGGAIVVGSGSTAATLADTRLTYEFDRTTINLVSPSFIDNKIIFKGTLDQRTIGTIYEVGLYSSSFGAYAAGAPSRAIAIFERDVETWNTVNFASGNQRLGAEALRLAPATSATVTNVLPSVNLDLSAYANSDQINVAFHNLNTNTATVRVRFRGLDPAAYYEYAIANPPAGYNVYSVTKSSLAKTGIVDFSAIDSIEVAAIAKSSGAAQVDFDGIRIESTTRTVDNVLVSRSVLGVPQAKTSVAPMDVEYALQVTI